MRSVQIPETMRALVVAGPDAPLELTDRSTPEPGPGEVLVQVAASPINPSDLLMVRGEYGASRPFPFVPGLEGSGRVVASGGGLLGRSLEGKLVACAPENDGIWADYVVVPANRCVPLPRDVPAGPGAMAFVNPFTAVALVQMARRKGHKAAVSTAAAGALGRMIRERAASEGVTIVDVVRRSEQAEALRSEGARYVLSTDAEDFDEALAKTCRELDCRLAFDAVAGEMSRLLAKALPEGAEIIVYGALSGEPMSIDPAAMTFKDLTVRGFWLSKWSSERSFLQQLMLTRKVMRALRGGFAETRVAAVCPLAEGATALQRYASDMSAGKVLISTGAIDLGV